MKCTKIKSMLTTLLLAFLPALVFGGEAKTESGPEIVVSPKGESSQWDPAAAFDGKGTYLVVWSDGTGNWGGDADIHGVRLKADGTVVDAKPIIIAKAKDFQKRPRVAWSGSEWLVVWQDWRSGKSYDIYAARVSGDGKVLDPEGVAVCTEKGDQVFPAVASDGAGGSLVVWADYRAGNYDIWGTALNDGKAGAPAALIAAAGDQMGSSVAWTGKQYLVACANGERSVNERIPGQEGAIMSLMTLRVGADGKPLDSKPGFHGFGINAYDSAMAAVGERVLLLGRQQSGKIYHPNTVYGIYMDADGKRVAHDNPGRPMFQVPLSGVCNPPPITMCSTDTGGALDVFCPAVAASGEWFLALHQEAGPIVRHQIINAKSGKVVEDGQLTAAGAREKTPGAAGGASGEFLLVYERNDAKEPNQRVCARVVKVK